MPAIIVATVPAASGPRVSWRRAISALQASAAYMSAVGSYRPSVHDGIWRVLRCTQRAGNSRPFEPFLLCEQACP